MRRTEWPDLEAWWLMADALVRAHPSLAVYFDAASLRAASGQAQPDADVGAQPNTDAGARTEADAGARFDPDAGMRSDAGTATGQTRNEADAGAAGALKCCWCTGAGKELAQLRLERRAPSGGSAAPTPPPPPHAIFDASGYLTCPALRPLQ